MILNRTLLKETFQTGGAVGLVLLSIFLVIRLVAVLRQAAEGIIPIDAVMQILLLRLVNNMDIILPLVLYVSVLMVLGRWSRDNEMTVVSACGISPVNLLKPMGTLCVIMGIVVGAFSLYFSPLSVRAIEEIQQEFESRDEIASITPGVFTETAQGGVYFVEKFNEEIGFYQNIFFYGQEHDEELVIISSIGFQSVDIQSNDVFLILKNGTRYTGTPGDPDYTVIDFETYAIRLEQREKSNLAIPVKGMKTSELLTSNHRIRVSELNWRISKIVVIPILVLFALSFSGVDNRSRRVSKMIFAFLIYFGYANFVGFAIALMRKGELNAVTGVWYVHLAFLLLSLWTFYRQVMNKSMFPSFGISFKRPKKRIKRRVKRGN